MTSSIHRQVKASLHETRDRDELESVARRIEKGAQLLLRDDVATTTTPPTTSSSSAHHGGGADPRGSDASSSNSNARRFLREGDLVKRCNAQGETDTHEPDDGLTRRRDRHTPREQASDASGRLLLLSE